MNMVSLVLDLLVVATIIIMIIFGANKGLIKSLLSFFLSVASVILCFFLNDLIAKMIYDNFFKSTLMNNIESIIEMNVSDPGEALLELLPNFVKNFLGQDELNNIIENFSSLSTEGLELILRPVIIGFIGILVFLILFLVLKIVCSFIIAAVDVISKFVIIKQVNAFLGGVFGLAESIIIIIVFCELVKVFSGYFVQLASVFSDNNIEASYIFSMFYNSQLADYMYGLLKI